MSKTITLRIPDQLMADLEAFGARKGWTNRTKVIVALLDQALSEAQEPLGAFDGSDEGFAVINVISPPAGGASSVSMPACTHTYVQGFRCLACGKAA